MSTRDGATNIWAIREKGGFLKETDGRPIQLTTGLMNFQSLVPSRDGKKLFALGVTKRGELVRFDAQSRQLVPYLGGISAWFMDFTRDSQWMTYVTYQEGSLWRSRLDGSERLQFTFPPMKVRLPRWSPDGKRIAFRGSASLGKPWKVYLVSAMGSTPEEQMPDDITDQHDPCWSPDGNSLAWGRYRVPEREIYVLNLKTRQISTLPGSQGLLHPEWSPDGRYLAAYRLTASGWHIVLFDFVTQKWTDVPDSRVNYHKWSHDGKYLLSTAGLAFTGCESLTGKSSRWPRWPNDPLMLGSGMHPMILRWLCVMLRRRKSTRWMWTFRSDKCQCRVRCKEVGSSLLAWAAPLSANLLFRFRGALNGGTHPHLLLLCVGARLKRMRSVRNSNVVRFGNFEADLRAGELRKQGVKLRLPEQSFQILAILSPPPGGSGYTRRDPEEALAPHHCLDVDFT